MSPLKVVSIKKTTIKSSRLHMSCVWQRLCADRDLRPPRPHPTPPHPFIDDSRVRGAGECVHGEERVAAARRFSGRARGSRTDRGLRATSVPAHPATSHRYTEGPERSSADTHTHTHARCHLCSATMWLFFAFVFIFGGT